MLLAVNIGNTHIRCGVFRGSALKHSFLFPSRPLGAAAWKRKMAAALGPERMAGAWEGVIAAGVVPRIKPGLLQALRGMFGKVLWISAQTKLPLANAYQPPRALGSDRMLGAVAAWGRYGAPVIIVDAGTAITINAVDGRARFVGGAILPGFQAALHSLAQRTALRPRVSLKAPAGLLGRSTQAGLSAGVIGGTGGAVASIIANIQKSFGRPVMVVGTGGGMGRLAPFCPAIRRTHPHLVLEGLRDAWNWKTRSTGRARRHA
jgi:type III pantothenate kinase